MGETPRPSLSRDHILASAVALADEVGIEALTIRKLATAIDTKPMSIYRHVASKEDIVDGMVERVFAEIQRPPTDHDWLDALRQRCISAKAALNRHPWAAPLMQSRISPGSQTLGHHNAVVGCLRRGGLTWPMVAHANAMLDAFIYGFALLEASLPSMAEGEFVAVVEDITQTLDPDAYPHLVGFTNEHVFQPGYDFSNSFEFGLDRILETVGHLATTHDPL